MTGNQKQYQDDLLSLTQQLNRQAFAQPPIEGWLNSFLALMCERFAPLTVRGVQVLQVIGNVALRMASAGTVPESSDQTPVDQSSPIAQAISNRQMATMPNAHLFPIMVGNDAIGVLIVYFNMQSNAAETLDTMMATLSIQLGPALLQHLKTPGPQTGRLIRQIEMMRSLYEVTRSFSSALDSPDLLNRAARTLVETLRIDHVGIMVLDYKERVGMIISEYPDNGMIGTKIPIQSPILERLQLTRSPVIVSNVDQSTDIGSERGLLQQMGIKSVAMLPMIVQKDLIGSVELDAFYDYHEFANDELEAAAAITSQLAISAHNAQLYDELRRRASQLERITELSRRVTSTFDRNRIFEIAREETQRIIDADLVVVAMRTSENSGMLTLFVLVDNGPLVTEVPVDKAALRFVFNTAEPLILDDISGSDEADYRLLTASQMRAAVVVPLIAGGRAIGAYCVLHREPGRYVAIDLAVLEQVGNQLAIALENARLYSQTLQRAETERLMNRLSGSIQSRGDLQSMVLRTVQEIAEALGARRARVRLEMPKKPTSDASTRLALSSKLVEKLSEKK